MKVAIIGSGYVGLVTGACLSENGLDVICVDVDKKKILELKKGILPIYEPGLEEIVLKNLDNKRLSFSSLKKSINDCTAIFIAVGTPSDEDGSADLKYVLKVAKEIGDNIIDYKLIITKSTVPIGTAQKVRSVIKDSLKKRNLNLNFDVSSNPEFLKEGSAVGDFMKPDRIVVGVDNEKSKKIFEEIYRPFTLNNHPIIFMDIPSSEMTKYAANAFLATKISFINDISNLCERTGANVNFVRKGIGSDPRIGDKFIYPGIGYGGSCFPKDVKALIKTGSDFGHPLRILESVENVNESQKEVLFNKLKKYFNNELKDKKIAIWGISLNQILTI